MAAPTAVDAQRLKRLGRYILGQPRGVLVFGAQAMPGEVRVEVDSDFAGDLLTRWSTTGLICVLGNHVLK
eukprot:9816619-Lingulodinium_polyedra.AAC.1